MIDRFKISLKAKLLDDVVTNPEKFSQALPDLQVSHGFNQRLKRRTAVLQILPNRALELFCEWTGQWVVRSISATAPALLYGSNGRLILSDAELLASLGRLKDLAGKVIDPQDHHLIVPGTHSKSDSWFSLLELPFHCADPDGSLMRAVRNIKHPEIQRRATHYEGETVELKGTGLALVVYQKDLQLAREIQKFGCDPDPATPVVRFEVRKRRHKIIGGFERPCLKRIGFQNRLVRFTLKELYDSFLTTVGELQGLFRSTAAKPAEPIARFLATIAREYGLPIDHLVERYAVEKGIAPSRATTIRSQAKTHFGGLLPYDLDSLFGEAAFRAQPQIVIPGLQAPLEGLVARYAFKDAAITRAYTRPSSSFVPQPVL